MTNRDLLTTEFPLTLPDGTVLAVRKLSFIGERKLFQELAARLLASYGPGSYMANAKGVLDWMADQKMHADRAQMVSEIARLVAQKATPTADAVDDYRQTPDGLAAELFLRTRQTHPQLAEQILRTQLTPLTAWQVCVSLWEGLASDRKSGPADVGGVAG